MAVAVFAAMAIFSSASAASLCTPGEGSGQCKQPRGLAVDEGTGHIYVADRGNNRINVFSEAGSFLFSFAGSGPSQLSSPVSVAVDNDASSSSRHDIYVVDFDNRRIEKFDEEGHFLLAFGEGEYAKEGSEITEKMLVATSAGSEQVYVVDVRRTPFNATGECVLGEIGGSAGKCLTTRLRRYAPGGGSPTFGKDIVTVPRNGGVGGNLRGIAVDSTGALYIRNDGTEESFCKYDAAGVKVVGFREAGCFPEKEGEGVTALTIDSEDDLFAWGLDGSYRVIAEYDAAGGPLKRFVYTKDAAFPEGLAIRPDVPVEPATPLYSSVGEEVRAVPFPEPGPITVGPVAEGITSTKALLHADVNPEGKKTTYRFEYVPAAICEEDETELGAGHCFDHAKISEPETLAIEGGTAAKEEEHLYRINRAPAEIGCPDPVKEAAEEESSCLVPETEYRWRIVATSGDGDGEGTLEGAPFTTTPPLAIEDLWATDVGTDSATLHATINPLGIPTTGHFEYIADAAYQANLAAGKPPYVGASVLPVAGDLDFGSGEAGVSLAAAAFPLAEGTTYHLRVVATDPLLADPVFSEAKQIATLSPSTPAPCASEGTRGGLSGARSGLAAFLPDCRAYELVSPLDKNNGDIVFPTTSLERPARLEESSVDGGKMAYASRTAFAEPEGAPWTSQYIATRLAGVGWASHAISSRRERALVKPLGQAFTELEAFSPDLCQGWLRTFSDPPLTEGAIEDNLNLYRRRDSECGGLSYEAITTIGPPDLASVVGSNLLRLQGVSHDGGRAIYTVNDTLPGTGAPAEPAECASNVGKCEQRLYSQSATEGTRYLCLLPGGAPAGSCAAGTLNLNLTRGADVANAISADGHRVFWSTPAPGEGKIYVSDNEGTTMAADDVTLPVSEEGEALSGTTKSRFWCAATNGSAAVYETGGDLYESDPASAATSLIAGEALGVAGCSEDVNRIYFASKEVLEGERVDEKNSENAEAVPGKPNLYLYHAGAGEVGSYAFIGTLAEADASGAGPLAIEPVDRLSRVTPSGGALAFMSRAPLTSFDNTDAQSGKADYEVFLYDATSDGLACASCNPTGARPLSGDSNRGDFEHEVAPRSAGWIPAWESSLYASRVLSEDGRRLFFESNEKLVARDTDGHTDVYQWEASGEGTCTADSLSYVAADKGCIDLISSGLDERDVEFRDASPSGEDVFFATQASLLPQDPGLVDIYDARSGGGLPVPHEAGSGCEGEACQSPPPGPEEPTPASSTYRGPGNDAQPHERRCPKDKRRIHRKSGAPCTKRHPRKAHRHHRRARRAGW